MHDLRLELRARNNVLWHAIFDLHPSVKAFCCAHTLSEQIVGGYLNLTRSPYYHPKSRMTGTSDRVICATALRICEVTGIGSDELWPVILYSGLIAPRRVAEVAAESCLALTAARRVTLPPAQEDALLDDERRQAIATVLDTLSPREAKIIRQRFGLGDDCESTLDEVAARSSCSRERVRQIEMKALRKLRHPARVKRLRAIYSTDAIPPKPEPTDNQRLADAANESDIEQLRRYLSPLVLTVKQSER